MSLSTPQTIFIRIAAIVFAVTIAALVPASKLFTAVIVFGQGHFLLGYLYQAEGGHFTRRKLIILAAILGGLLYAAFSLPILVAGFLTGMAFLGHFVYDEIRLVNGSVSKIAILEAAPFAVLYASLFTDAVFALGVLPYAAILILGLLILYALACLLYRHRPGRNMLVFTSWAVVAAVVYSVSVVYAPASTVTWLWGIVLIHYVIWYGFYWFKLEGKPAMRTTYVKRVIVLNAILVALGFLWVGTNAFVLALLFSPLAFYVWTFLHMISSLRFAQRPVTAKSA